MLQNSLDNIFISTIIVINNPQLIFNIYTMAYLYFSMINLFISYIIHYQMSVYVGDYNNIWIDHII